MSRADRELYTFALELIPPLGKGDAPVMGRIGWARLILAATLALGGRAIALHAQGTIDVAQAFIRAVYSDLRMEGNAFSVSLSPTSSTVGADAIWSRLNNVGVRVLRPLEPERTIARPARRSIRNGSFSTPGLRSTSTIECRICAAWVHTSEPLTSSRW
jgi:hypothetical protein